MTSHQPAIDPRSTAFWVGFATVAAQALLLRESMAAMGGSELAWGMVMALWLAGVGIGARVGVHVGSRDLAMWLPIVVLLLAGAGIVLLRASPAIIGGAPGEIVTTSSAIWLWMVAIVPAALAGGLAFPVLANAMGPGGGGRAYGFEAVGALVGGIALSFALVRASAAGALCLGLGTVLAAAAWQRRSAAAAVLAATAIAASVVAGGALARAGWMWSGHPDALGAWMETRHQQIAASHGPPISVYGDGRLLATYPDQYSVLPRAHLVMLLHPQPRNVLAIGCVVDGSIEAMAKHPIERLTVVEEDADLLRAIPSLYGAAMETVLGSRSVRAVADDPLQVLEKTKDLDVVILLDGNPSTLRKNRTRTLEFMRRCRASLRPDGVLVMRVAVRDTYVGGVGSQRLSGLASTVGEVFKNLAIIPGEETLLVAGGPKAEITIDHDILAERLADTGLSEEAFPPEMIPLLVDTNRSADLFSNLSVDSAPNTIGHPRAVFLAGALHEARSLPGLLSAATAVERRGGRALAAALCVAVLALLVSAAVHRRSAGTTAAAVGFCSMGWWLLLMSVWQSTNGSVYSEIGVLTGLFMAGIAAGALAANWLEAPERWLPLVLAGGSVLSAALALGAAVGAPTIMVPLFLAVGGLITGAAFPGLTHLGPGETRRTAGVVFAADEVGAAAAALVVGIFVIPWAGLAATATGLAILQAAAIPATLTRFRRW